MDISVEELKERMDSGEKITLIDVREPRERDEFNIGGELIPLGSLPTSVSRLEEHKDEEVVVYCRSGNRSGRAAQFLRQAGFRNVRNLEGGMLAWIENFG